MWNAFWNLKDAPNVWRIEKINEYNLEKENFGENQQFIAINRYQKTAKIFSVFSQKKN